MYRGPPIFWEFQLSILYFPLKHMILWDFIHFFSFILLLLQITRLQHSLNSLNIYQSFLKFLLHLSIWKFILLKLLLVHYLLPMEQNFLCCMLHHTNHGTAHSFFPKLQWPLTCFIFNLSNLHILFLLKVWQHPYL